MRDRQLKTLCTEAEEEEIKRRAKHLGVSVSWLLRNSALFVNQRDLIRKLDGEN